MKYEVADQKLTKVLDLIKSSTELHTKESKHVTINDTAIETFTKNLDFEKIKEGTKNGLPIKFDTIQEEVNFHVLKSVLQFGSGYRHLLHKHLGRGANECITYGLFALILSDKKLDAFMMSQVTLMDIERDFGVKHQKEAPHPSNSFIKIQVDSELKPFADKLKFVFNDCGRALRSFNCNDFGEFVLKVLKSLNFLKFNFLENQSAENLIEELVKSFPAFNDVSKDKNGNNIYFFKKAQLAGVKKKF
jgi:hypothetical protein